MNRTNTAIVVVIATAASLVAASLVGGCGSQRRDVPYTEPVGTSDPVVARGEIAFMTHCHQCHPGGAGGLAPAINDKPLPEGLIKTQIRNGLGAMPAFDEQHIPDQDVDAIVAYLKALRAARERVAAK